MKTIFHIAAGTLVLLSCSFAAPKANNNVVSKSRTVEMPPIAAANTTNLDVRGVTLTDTATTLQFNVNFRPGWWVRLSPDSKIIADGKAYSIISAKGIALGEELYMPESGDTTFYVSFQPIPHDTKSIDFTEGADGWKLWGIGLDGFKHNSVTPTVSGDVDSINLNPELKAEETTLRFHVLNYKPDFGNSMEVMLSGVPDNSTEIVKLDENGTGSLTTTLFGPTALFCTIPDFTPYASTSVVVLPGEDTDIYFDSHISVNTQMSRRDENYQMPRSLYDNGQLAAFNWNREKAEDFLIHPFFNPAIQKSWRMTPDEYTDNVINERNRLVSEINASDMPANIRQFAIAKTDISALSAVAMARRVMANQLYNTYSNQAGFNPNDSIKDVPGDEQLARVVKTVDLHNPALMLTGNYGDLWSIDWSKFTDDVKDKEFYRFNNLFKAASKGKLTEEQLTEAREMSLPYYADALAKRNEIAVRQNQEAAKLIQPNPEVAPDQLFAEIVKPYAGKVVLVDLWNTWCQPCRNALKANEPLKTGEFANEDVVWLYIADESSDMNTYLNLLPTIKGVHHIVNEEQIRKIREQFNVDGIPFYILVDRQGNAEPHPDFRDHNLLIQGIKSKL